MTVDDTTLLTKYGWCPELEAAFAALAPAGLAPGRVTCAQRERYDVLTGAGELAAEVSGRFRHQARNPADFPTVGDWVAVASRPGEGAATIHALLPRLTRFSRRAAGTVAREQLVAANVDVALLVAGLDRDFNLRRLERYLVLVHESGARPVLILNKADLCPDVPGRVADAQAVAGPAPVLAVSALTGAGLSELRAQMGPGRTGALLGSSGVGKSALVNALLGEERALTGALRASDGRGRHTTCHRELFLLPDGGVLVDSPGLRELQVWADGEAVDEAFEEVDALAEGCRFRDCTHVHEPGCAVLEALERGELDPGRVRNWQGLRREVAGLERRRDARARRAERSRGKAMAQRVRERLPETYGS